MTQEEKRQLVDQALARSRAADSAWSLLESAVGHADTESPLGAALFYAIHDLLDITSRLIGDSDGSLEWFVYDNSYGEKGLEWTVRGYPPIACRTVGDLMRCIEITADGQG